MLFVVVYGGSNVLVASMIQIAPLLLQFNPFHVAFEQLKSPLKLACLLRISRYYRPE